MTPLGSRKAEVFVPDLLVKICGMRNQEDVDCAAAAGADMCGFVFARQSPRALTPAQAAALDSRGMLRVGVFVTSNAQAVAEAAMEACLDFVQLHGSQPEECAGQLAGILGARRIIRTLWPARYGGLEDLAEDMQRHAACAGMFLLEAGTEGGGSGRRMDVPLRGLRAPRPWILAGGLNPKNVGAAIKDCEPDGVDFNSGLESAPGRKSAQRIRAAVAAVREYR